MRLASMALTALLLASTSGCAMQTGATLPSSWARTYPDTAHVMSGRLVRFAGHYGLTGPSPAVLFHEANGTVTGEVLVWFSRKQAGVPSGQPVADSAKLVATYGCTAWAQGYQEGAVWLCRVPEKQVAVDWAAELARLDSLVAAQRSVEQLGRRPAPVAPPPPAKPGVAQLPKQGQPCMDGGSWYIQTRDTRGIKLVSSPQPGMGCLPPDGPAKTYDQAGWTMLKEFIAAVK